MRDTWLVKNYGHVLRRGAPSSSDVFSATPFVWIDIVTDMAYVCTDFSSGVANWAQKTPDKIIETPSNSVFVIETIEASETVTFQGETVTISGETATW